MVVRAWVKEAVIDHYVATFGGEARVLSGEVERFIWEFCPFEPGDYPCKTARHRFRVPMRDIVTRLNAAVIDKRRAPFALKNCFATVASVSRLFAILILERFCQTNRAGPRGTSSVNLGALLIL